MRGWIRTKTMREREKGNRWREKVRSGVWVARERKKRGEREVDCNGHDL